jgi:uncharacterized membrane protein YbaN (DUF454 family)
MNDLESLPAGRVTNLVVRWLLMGAGFLLVAIGVLGIFLPLLPTTVFFLLAAACFGRSSPSAYRWLTTNRFFGRYLRDYRERRGATLGTKLFSIATLWAGMGFSAFLLEPPIWVDAMLAAIALGVTWHLVSLKTLRGEESA